jgi:hypothetical protein
MLQNLRLLNDDLTPQVENFTLDIMGQIAVEMQVH